VYTERHNTGKNTEQQRVRERKVQKSAPERFVLSQAHPRLTRGQTHIREISQQEGTHRGLHINQITNYSSEFCSSAAFGAAFLRLAATFGAAIAHIKPHVCIYTFYVLPALRFLDGGVALPALFFLFPPLERRFETHFLSCFSVLPTSWATNGMVSLSNLPASKMRVIILGARSLDRSPDSPEGAPCLLRWFEINFLNYSKYP